MSTIARAEIPTEEFALHETLGTVPDVVVEIERVVAHGDDRVMPIMWVSGDGLDFAALTDALDRDSTVDGVELFSDLGEERLYRMEWTDGIQFLLGAVVSQEATILEAHGSKAGWDLRLLFPDREALRATHDYCETHGLSVEVRSVTDIDDTPGGRHGLTDAQYETLVSAYEAGYYRIPRSIDGTALADEFGISHQALSERLRRATDALIENTLLVNGDADGRRQQ